MNTIQRIITVISLPLLAACGGGGGGGSSAPTTQTQTQTQTQTVNGVVADGYLKGATVCLDTSLNKKCDSGEPTATTGTGGAYSIANVSTADLAIYPIVVEVPAGAVDSERGAVATGYILTAPAGRPEFVSPLTTLVQNRIETDGLSMTEAVATVKTQLGLTTLSPLDDYKPGVAGAAAEAVLAAGVAKVIATTIADNKKAIETAVAGSSTPVTVQQVVNLIVQQVMQNLSTVVLQVRTETNNGANALAEDRVAGVISGSGVTVPTTDTAALQQQLAAAGTANSGSTRMKLTIALQGSGASNVKGLQAIATLPAGLLLRADPSGKPLSGVLAATGSAASALLDGKYTPAAATAPATLSLGLITTGNLAAGDIIVITCDLAAGSTAPAAGAVSFGNSKLIDNSGNIVNGASLVIR